MCFIPAETKAHGLFDETEAIAGARPVLSRDYGDRRTKRSMHDTTEHKITQK